MSFPMRDGSVAADIRLGRLPQPDERNNRYPIRALLKGRPPRTYSWRCVTYLDQGQTPECASFGFAHEVIARPVEQAMDAAEIHRLYHRAQVLDDFPGTAYDGTSVLGAVKAYTEAGHYGEYRWAVTPDDAIEAIAWHGPIVLGINWYADMMDTDAKGFIHPTGGIVGGHAICVIGVSTKLGAVRLRNSWGRAWGKAGDCFLSFTDLAEVLAEQDAECCVPVSRKLVS